MKRGRQLFDFQDGYQGLFGITVADGPFTLDWVPPTSAGFPVTHDGVSGPFRIRSLYCGTGVAVADAGKNWTTKLYSGQPTGGNVVSTVTISLGSTGFIDGEDVSSDHLWYPGDAWWLQSVWDTPIGDYAWVVQPFIVAATWEIVT